MCRKKLIKLEAFMQVKIIVHEKAHALGTRDLFYNRS